MLYYKNKIARMHLVQTGTSTITRKLDKEINFNEPLYLKIYGNIFFYVEEKKLHGAEKKRKCAISFFKLIAHYVGLYIFRIRRIKYKSANYKRFLQLSQAIKK
jgi:hypothetical protein